MSRAKDAMKHAVGWFAERAFPSLANEIDEARNTEQRVVLKRCILHARMQQAKAKGDYGSVEKSLSAFWAGDSGDKFFSGDANADARFERFLKQHHMVIDALRDFLDLAGSDFHRLVEIGCGEGRVLTHCFEQIPAISSAIGLDINKTIIDRASAEYAAVADLSFFNSDGVDWLEANPSPGTVVLFNGGVLEYFSSVKFDNVLKALAACPPAAIALIEPVAADHDLENDVTSRIFGGENSFSHNHRHRLSEAGFEVIYSTELKEGGIRWVLMLGVFSSAPKP
ncbi:MAG: hypothetical protein COB93_09575 [Sneathiella sp.]|nr:MAG: hypothetical protein COB93_09575 [Sneathiella sp.]